MSLSSHLAFSSNAGGGGERVLWAAISAIQRKEPDIISVVYSGDTDTTKEKILEKVKVRFSYAVSNSKLSCRSGEVRHRTLPQVLAFSLPTLPALGRRFYVAALHALGAEPGVHVSRMGSDVDTHTRSVHWCVYSHVLP